MVSQQNIESVQQLEYDDDNQDQNEKLINNKNYYENNSGEQDQENDQGISVQRNIKGTDIETKKQNQQSEIETLTEKEKQIEKKLKNLQQKYNKHYLVELSILIEIQKNIKDEKLLDDEVLEYQVDQMINILGNDEEYVMRIVEKNLDIYPFLITFHIDFFVDDNNTLFIENDNGQNKTHMFPKQDDHKKVGYLYHFEDVTAYYKKQQVLQSQQEQQFIQQPQQQLQQQPEEQKQSYQNNQQIQQELYKQYERKYYDIANITQSGSVGTVLLKRRRYIKEKESKSDIIAEKTITNLPEIELQRLIECKTGQILDDARIDGKNKSATREIKFLYEMKQNNINHPQIINFKNFVVSKEKRTVKILFEYFGGHDFKGCNVNQFFVTKKYHKDLGIDNPKAVQKFLSQIFLQAVEGISFFHTNQKAVRDFKDDNILIRRINNDQVQCKLIDFGLSGTLDKDQSIKRYGSHIQYRDPQISGFNFRREIPYKPAYDIYSLGHFLKMIYIMYYDVFNQDEIEKIGYERFEENIINPLFPIEKALYDFMKSDIKDRPNSIEDLRNSEIYTQYLKQL